MGSETTMYENIDKKHLLLLMEEAYLLPEDDVKRKNIENIIANFVWAKEQWELLQKENSILSKSLNNIEIPHHLKNNLLKIPNAKHNNPKNSLFWRVAVAACFLFILLYASSYYFKNSQNTNLQNIIAKSITWHYSPMGMDVETSQREELYNYFLSKTNIEPNWNKVDNRFHLRGGKVLSWENNNVLCSVWNTEAGYCTLIQFEAPDFSLPENDSKKIWDQKTFINEEILKHNFLCMSWIKNNNGHVWIIENSEGAKELFSLAQK